jgi:transcriptional regulator with XRE-family HTH domain|nr:MAG TPA: Repressor protein CI [Caudoviricetes sp.]DAG99025.1 MAG TPA: Repressor protein CI [Herelleviridae sp.]DAI92259.1 MAG TPA: Repressor protein CI [Bacteriophage sp.]DAI97093.1 MAG TPA: Repressor protein CI [Caudoviricetes sp.]DAJ33209.1 MAG TPA: Repressor protein CI [Herelleviridae sp.]
MMTDEEQKKIFSNNLNKYISLSGKQQKEVAEAVGTNPSTFNMWCKGNSMPGTGKIRALADYFRIGMSDLTDLKEEKEIDAEYSDVSMKIGLTDPRFMKIILEYDKLSPDKKDLLCDFFEKFIF